MPPKAKLQAPIDRPLSRAYLRQFTGWSTAYPPGTSEPSSLRDMKNVMINRDGSVKVRPGLRLLTYRDDGAGGKLAWGGANLFPIGSHEPFFLNNGQKAYLFAAKDMTNNRVAFYAAYESVSPDHPLDVKPVVDAAIGFRDKAGSTLQANAPGFFTAGTSYVKYAQIDNKILALSNNGEPAKLFYAGATKRAFTPQAITRPSYTKEDNIRFVHPDYRTLLQPQVYQSQSLFTTKTLMVPQNTDDGKYYFAYFYTFSNEFGESAPSRTRVVKLRRPWSQWNWTATENGSTAAGASNEPGPDEVDDPARASDQMVLWPDQDAFAVAKAQGATHFNVYCAMWSDQDVVPTEAQLIGAREIGPDQVDANHTFVRHTPAPYDQARSMSMPTEFNRYNYSVPPTSGQALVAADRMVMVYDPVNPAVIRWTSSFIGEYINFTSSRGGGYKTLTSGNLYVPACVKLWQNPQSADTITILCLGVDGQSTAFYMAPAQVASQSDATNVMGFEETTATPGTVSPYGCEVLNNALYHPLEDALVKSTASNYNINHKSMTDLVINKWSKLKDKKRIVSSFLENRLYYLVHNPEGEQLKPNCWGNEVWVLDTGLKDGGTWSRWTVQGQSLRKIEIEGQLRMSIVTPDGIFTFDEDRFEDDVVNVNTRTVSQRPIPWSLETNTQGANRAHDAWAHLQQLNLVVGNFTGQLEYGVTGWDLHGKRVERKKILKDTRGVSLDNMPWDIEDQLQVRRDMKEWRFFARSVPTSDEVGAAHHHSQGQVSLVQYRYTPVSVNVGYEYGAIETFEYGRSDVQPTVYENGIPVPVNDYVRP